MIEAFVRPALAEIQGADGQHHYSRLRAMLAAEDAPLFAQLVTDNFDQSSGTFVAALRNACRAFTPTMSCGDSTSCWARSTTPRAARSGSRRSPRDAATRGRRIHVRHLVPFLATAFRSAAVTPPGTRRRVQARAARAGKTRG